ncbi:MAG TPA: DinB family protein [Pyrinomonadaceae bacterium]|jgi:hypothetical protein|nr:DinB family protein [Pyrinomonadaceae bacterium]
MTQHAPTAEGVNFTTLLKFLNETPDKLKSFAAELGSAEIRWSSSPDEFSVLENICHLRDLELQGYGPRIRRILAEPAPALADFDGARVAAESNYNSEQLDAAMLSFETARRENVEILRTLSDGKLNRTGTLEGVGSVTLRRLAELMREHDEGHLDDLRVLSERLRQAREE